MPCFFSTLIEIAKADTAMSAATRIVTVGNSGITALAESTEVDGVTKLTLPPAVSSESSTSCNVNPADPVLVTVKVTVAMVPLPENAGVLAPVEVAKMWYSASDWEAVFSTTSIG